MRYDLVALLPANALAAGARLVDAATVQARAGRARPRHPGRLARCRVHLGRVMMPVFVGSGAGVGRAGKRKQRHDSNGSNLHDHLLQIEKGKLFQIEKGKLSWRRLVQSGGVLARALELRTPQLPHSLIFCDEPNSGGGSFRCRLSPSSSL
jgi:hypothetical protein